MNKAFFVALSLVFGVSSIALADGSAEVVTLDRAHVQLDSGHVVVAITDKTPAKVVLHMPLAFNYTVCTKYETQYVWGPHPSCGTYPYPYDHETHPPHHRPYPPSGHPHYRSCYHPVTVCVEYGERVSEENRKLVLKLKNVAIAGEELFELSGSQAHKDSSNAVYSFDAFKTSKDFAIKVKSFLYDRVVISDVAAVASDE